MPASHRQAWARHFLEYPPGDFHNQHLLAALLVMFHAANKGEKERPLNLVDIAPHLVPPSVRAEDKKRRQGASVASRALAISRMMDAKSKRA